jgi:L-fuconolactonase
MGQANHTRQRQPVASTVSPDGGRGFRSGSGERSVPLVIDAHHHLWDVAAREHRWLVGGQPWATDAELARLRRSFRLADLAPLAAASGVTGTVVIQTVTEPWETPDLLALAAGRDPYAGEGQARGTGLPGGGPADGAEPAGDAGATRTGGLLVGVVGWIDLAAAAAADALAGLRALPGGSFLCGIRHPLLIEPDPAWLVRPAVLRGLRALAAAGLAFDVAALPHQLPAAVTAARAVPELAFVLDHLAGPPAGTGQGARAGPWAPAIASLAELPNVTCKLSGMHTNAASARGLRPYYETVLAAFGPDRLLFGSDWPVCTLAAPYGQVCDLYRELTAQLSAAEQDAIFDHTARRVYRIAEPEPPGTQAEPPGTQAEPPGTHA